LCTNSRSAGESQKNQNRAKFVKIVIGAHRNKRKRKRKLHQYFCNLENFQLHTKALVGLLQISLSPHTVNKGALQFPHTRHSLSSLSLSLSPAPYGGKFKPEWAGIRNCTPCPRVSILGINFNNHRHPKIKYPD
jgi:hypothetical protein